MIHTKELKYIAVFFIIIAWIYFWFQERPLVKVWDREIIIINEERDKP